MARSWLLVCGALGMACGHDHTSGSVGHVQHEDGVAALAELSGVGGGPSAFGTAAGGRTSPDGPVPPGIAGRAPDAQDAGGSPDGDHDDSVGESEWPDCDAGDCEADDGGVSMSAEGGASMGADGGTSTGADGGEQGPPAGALGYESIVNTVVMGDFVDVAWHPSGRFALLLAANGTIARFTPGEDSVTQEVALPLSRGAQIAAAPSGDYFLIVGNDGPSPELWLATHEEDDSLTFKQQAGALAGTIASVRPEPGTDRFAIASRLGAFQNALYSWTPSMGLSAATAYTALAGVSDVAWMDDGNVLVSEGVNGAHSSTWNVTSGAVTENGYEATCGNLAMIAWRPAGHFGFVAGWSSNRVCIFDGSDWTATELPGSSAGASPYGVAWHPSGRRALTVGRAVGAPLVATVFDYQGGSGAAYDATSWVDASIPDFDMAPYSADSATRLLAASWRPASDCDEGLIVGSDTGSVFDPNNALVIRFYDSTDPDCE